MHLVSGLVSGVGAVREMNQDNFYLNDPYNGDISDTGVIVLRGDDTNEGFFAVADGMGGEKHGELAALIAVSSLNQLDRSRGVDGVLEYLNERNEDICDLIRRNGGVRSGSTFVGVNLRDSEAALVNIGDSRGYLFRDGDLTQLSVDHTSVHAMVELGILTKEAAAKHPGRHELTQHLGIFPEEMLIEPYSTDFKLMAGDRILLCSDGLYEMVDDGAICQILRDRGSPDETAQRLYSRAMAVRRERQYHSFADRHTGVNGRGSNGNEYSLP